ncbi:MAG: ribonuclease E/G [Nitrospirota bacterium]
MACEIIINVAKEESRVALLENKVVTELYVDRNKNSNIVGAIYKGKVIKILPGMQASFVEIGLQRAAFLYVSDIIANYDDYSKVMENGSEYQIESNDEMGKGRRNDRQIPIEDILQDGQDILVQVSKDFIGTKGPRVTTYISLPGRYLVYMPTVNHVGISRRIVNEEERTRLKNIIMRMKKPADGYIVRTVSEGIGEEEFRADMEFLELLWQNVLKKNEHLSAPARLHTDLDLIPRVIRDLFSDRIDRLVIDSKEEYEKISDFVETYIPDMSSRIELYDKDEPIFEAYEIEMEISKALNRRVWLKSGGYIVIDQTEALTVIDVNTGKYVGKRSLEDTILKTNLEAAKEIAYQVRLRNIGGIIITDFIDMEKKKNREKVFSSLRDAMISDRAKTNILRISELGLVEMSRERIRGDIQKILCEPCSYCEGKGHIKSAATVCYEIFREITHIGPSSSGKEIAIKANPDIANLLFDEERDSIEDLEEKYNIKIIVKSDPNIHIEQFDIAVT